MDILEPVTGDRIVYVGGDARGLGGDIGGGGHAWNAVELNGRWYLLDATWNAGSVSGNSFNKQYSSTYLFTPPDIFISDHIPDDNLSNRNISFCTSSFNSRRFRLQTNQLFDRFTGSSFGAGF